MEATTSSELNMSKMAFVAVLIVVVSVGVWQGLQWTSFAGFTEAGRQGFVVLLATSFVAGIVIPMAMPKVSGTVLGSLLGGLATGMLLGIYIPGLIAAIPPDTVTAIVTFLGGGVAFGQDWGGGGPMTVLVLVAILVTVFFLGLGLKILTESFYGWLHR